LARKKKRGLPLLDPYSFEAQCPAACFFAQVERVFLMPVDDRATSCSFSVGKKGKQEIGKLV
jgi:hypothetical protein